MGCNKHCVSACAQKEAACFRCFSHSSCASYSLARANSGSLRWFQQVWLRAPQNTPLLLTATSKQIAVRRHSCALPSNCWQCKTLFPHRHTCTTNESKHGECRTRCAGHTRYVRLRHARKHIHTWPPRAPRCWSSAQTPPGGASCTRVGFLALWAHRPSRGPSGKSIIPCWKLGHCKQRLQHAHPHTNTKQSLNCTHAWCATATVNTTRPSVAHRTPGRANAERANLACLRNRHCPTPTVTPCSQARDIGIGPKRLPCEDNTHDSKLC